MSGLLLFHVPLGRSALGRIERARTLCKRVATVHGGGRGPPRGPEPAVAVDQDPLAPHGEAFLSRTTACLCSSDPRRRFQTRHPDSGTPPYFRRSHEFGIAHDGFTIDMAGVR